jgi:protein-S-isoprenylcysteine O-methyltransferase Ste14
MDLFDCFQITILVVFYAVFIGRLLKMLMAGTNPLVLGSGKRMLERVLEISFLPGLVIWSYEIIAHSLHFGVHVFVDSLYRALFEIVYLRIAGCLLIYAGVLIFIFSLVSFGRSWRVGIDTKNPGALVTTGIFSITRNPIFLFLDMYFMGTWLIYPNAFFGIAAVLAIAGIHWQILQEEKFLTKQYGKEYEDYLNKAPRYIW